MTTPTPTYFALESALAARLATIPGVAVKPALTTEEDELRRLAGQQPTLAYAYGGDEVLQSNPDAIRLQQRWIVSLLLRGAGTLERKAVDGELVLQLVKALHGWTPDVQAFEPLTFEGIECAVFDKTGREYAASFITETTVQTGRYT